MGLADAVLSVMEEDESEYALFSAIEARPRRHLLLGKCIARRSQESLWKNTVAN